MAQELDNLFGKPKSLNKPVSPDIKGRQIQDHELREFDNRYFDGEASKSEILDASDSLEAFLNEKPKFTITERNMDFPEGPMKYAYISYWSKFFDVSTEVVLRRVLGATFPFRKSSIFKDRYFDESPELDEDLMPEKTNQEKMARHEKFDLWAPMWIMFTLNVSLFICGSVSQYLEEVFHLKHQKSLMKVNSIGLLIFFYSMTVPLLLWAFFHFLGN